LPGGAPVRRALTPAAVALYALLAGSAFTTVYDPLPDLPLAVDLATLALPSLGLGLAVGRFWPVALPFLLAIPYALADDDGSNAFAYRLPALAIGVFALAAAVLVLTGVLLRTGRRPPPASVGAALMLLGAVPLAWAGYRQLRPLDESGEVLIADDPGSFRAVRLGAPRVRVIAELGSSTGSRGSSIAPIGEDFDHIGGPPFIATPGSRHETLRYRDTSVLLADDRVYGFVITDEDAETTAGVGVGDSLEVARDAYPSLDCGIARAGEYRTFPYCGGSLGLGRWIWFGQDPIRSIVLASTELATG
jgi:hypothetical protein